MGTIEEILKPVHRYWQLLVIATGVAALFLLGEKIQDTISRLIFLYLFAAIAYKMDGRIPIAAGLILLVAAALFTGRGRESFANQIAIYAYYFLVVGVVLQLIEYVREGGDIKENGEESAGSETGRSRGHAPPAPLKELSKKGKPARYLAVASGKGGVGKTTIAANLGVALSRMGRRVTVVDMDLAMPNLEIITGLRAPPVGLVDVLEDGLDIRKVTYQGPEGVRVIPPGVMLDGYKKNLKRIRQVLKEIPDENEFVIMDMPPGREAVDILDRSMDAILIVNPDKASVLDALNMKILLEKKGSRIIGVILNRAGGSPDRWIDEIERTLEVDVVCVIPESRVVKDAFSMEECFVSINPGCVPSKEIIELAEELIKN